MKRKETRPAGPSEVLWPPPPWVFPIAIVLVYGICLVLVSRHGQLSFPWNPDSPVLYVLLGLGFVAGAAAAQLLPSRVKRTRSWWKAVLWGIPAGLLAMLSLPIAYFLNQRIDPFNPRMVEATVVSKSLEDRDGRGEASVLYRLVISTPFEDPVTRVIGVPFPDWSGLKSGDAVQIRVGRGLFGLQYVVAVEAPK